MPRTLNEKEITAFRNKLCQTAEDLFITHGVNGFTMRRLASALGVSAMTPYRYYRNKSDLLAAVRMQAFRRLADRLQQICLTSAPPDERLRRVCEAYTDFANRHPDQYHLMFSADREDGETDPDMVESYQICLSPLCAILKDNLPPAVADDVREMKKLTLALWAALHGIITTSGIIGQQGPEDIRRQTDVAACSLLDGARALQQHDRHPEYVK